MSVRELLERLGSSDPAPGGGAAAAVAGALGAALVQMTANLSIGRPKLADIEAQARQIEARAAELRRHLAELGDADAQAYERVSAAYKLPRQSPLRAPGGSLQELQEPQDHLRVRGGSLGAPQLVAQDPVQLAAAQDTSQRAAAQDPVQAEAAQHAEQPSSGEIPPPPRHIPPRESPWSAQDIEHAHDIEHASAGAAQNIERSGSAQHTEHAAAQDPGQPLSAQHPERSVAIQAALRQAAAVPLDTARLCADVLALADEAAPLLNPAVISDVMVGALLAQAALESAALNVEVNLAAMTDAGAVAQLQLELDRARAGSAERLARILATGRSRLPKPVAKR